MQRLFGVLVALPTLACSVPPYSARIVDASGEALPTTTRDGRVVVSSKVGQTYAIAIENSTAEPVAAVIAIDGLDVGTGQIVDPTPSKRFYRSSWGLEAYTHTAVEGFALSNALDSTFRLADAMQSIAAHVGKPENVGRIEIGFYKAVPIASAEVISLDFARTRTRPAGATSESVPEGPPPIFGALKPTTRTGVPKYEIDRSGRGRELQRFVFLVEGPRGERLGTVGPPPSARAASMPLARPAVEAEDGHEDVKSPRPVKGSKPIKGTKEEKPKAPPQEAPKTPKPGKSSS